MATLQEMRALVSQRLDQALVAGDVPASDVFWPRSQINDWINNGRRQVYATIAELEAPTLVAEATGTWAASTRSQSIQAVFTLTDDPLKLDSAWDITDDATGLGGKIDFMHYQQLEAMQGGLAANAVNRSSRRVVAWWGSNPMNLVLYPVPSQALTLRLRYVPAVPTALAADGDTPSEIPTTHHDLLVLWAVVQAKKKEENASWKDDYQTYIERLDGLKNSIEERYSGGSRMTFVTDPVTDGYYL